MKPRSISNRKLTLLRKLNQKKYRYKELLFLLEGSRSVQQVLQNHSIEVEALFFDENQQYWLQKEWQQTKNIHSYSLSSDLFAEVSDTDNPQGVLAMCQMPGEIPLEKLASGEGVVIALDGLQDPGNLGTIIRTATWFDVAGIISGKGTVDLFHPKVVRGTAGATGIIPYANAELSSLLPELEAAGWNIYLLDASADAISLAEAAPPKKSVIVVGNEANGVDPSLITGSRKKVRISSPRPNPGVESLNAAVAASIAMYSFSGAG